MAFKMKGFPKIGNPKETKYLDDKTNPPKEKTSSVAGQSLVKVKGGYKDEDTGIVYKDPNNAVVMSKKAPGLVQDESYTVRGNVITGVK